MILLDTNVIVALLDERDRLQPAAVRDLAPLLRRRQSLATTAAVLSEVCHLLRSSGFRMRLRNLIEQTPIQVLASMSNWEELLSWLIRYGEHRPDWVDAELVMISAVDPKVRVWSYDHEFWTIWRRPDGSRVPLVVRPRP